MPEYSISQLDNFEECPRQYKFRYVDKVMRYEESIEAFLGQRFHDAMEWLYGEQAFRSVPLEELLEYYEQNWAENWHLEVKIRKEGRSADDYRMLGRRFIEDYYRRHAPFDEGKVLGLERFIRFPLDDQGRYRCKGMIDRLMIAPDGAYEVHDYKTGSKLPEQEELDEDRQLALYQVGVQTLWPDAKLVRLVWHLVAFDVEMRSSRTPGSLGKLRAELAALIDRVEAEREYAPHESALCDWCAYQDLCPAKKHLIKVEALPRDKWKDEPGVKIADDYAELWREKKDLEAEVKAIEAELDGIREAAVAFAEREGVSAIAGTDVRLRVSAKERLVAPAKGSAEREALEKDLRAAGVWDEVSALDGAALEKAVAEGKWTADVLERIKAFLSTEKRYTVTLKDDA